MVSFLIAYDLTFMRHFPLYFNRSRWNGTEKWTWMSRHGTSNRGSLFAPYTGKYLTFHNGTLWSVSSRSQDSIWYLESV